MTKSPADLRRNYDRAALTEAEAADDPFDQFAAWFADASAAGILEPNAMTLATASANGRPSARTVLLKGVDRRGFTFFTNRESRKGEELAARPWAALLFWWDALHRQVRIEGPVEVVEDEEADTYFASRPYGSRVGAWASPQSRVIPDRDFLETQEAAYQAMYPEGSAVPRPPHWGGYRVVPEAVEFWQGRPSRLHDRLRYRLEGGVWVRERLAP
jgi:pyridoxamine 5'-phosphate oxidase